MNVRRWLSSPAAGAELGARSVEADRVPSTPAPTVAEILPSLQALTAHLGQLVEAAFRDGVATGLRELVWDDEVETKADEHASKVAGLVALALLRHLDRMQLAEGKPTLTDLMETTP